jgi:hypothetical protein
MLVLIWSRDGNGEVANPGFPTTMLAHGLSSESIDPIIIVSIYYANLLLFKAKYSPNAKKG